MGARGELDWMSGHRRQVSQEKRKGLTPQNFQYLYAVVCKGNTKSVENFMIFSYLLAV